MIYEVIIENFHCFVENENDSACIFHRGRKDLMTSAILKGLKSIYKLEPLYEKFILMSCILIILWWCVLGHSPANFTEHLFS